MQSNIIQTNNPRNYTYLAQTVKTAFQHQTRKNWLTQLFCLELYKKTTNGVNYTVTNKK